MTLKLAEPTDLPEMVAMVQKFAKASPYAELPIETEKLEELLLSLLKDKNKTIVVLYLVNEKPVGMLAGMASEMLFSRELVASELVWWVEPSFRGRKALSLKEAYEFWAKRIGAKYIQMSALGDEKMRRFYERTGYRLTENSYLKVIGA